MGIGYSFFMFNSELRIIRAISRRRGARNPESFIAMLQGSNICKLLRTRINKFPGYRAGIGPSSGGIADLSVIYGVHDANSTRCGVLGSIKQAVKKLDRRA